MNSASEALARTVQLVADDVFDTPMGKDLALEAAILEGLQNTTVRLIADVNNLFSRSGQVALTTLFGQLAMMGLKIDLSVPDVPVRSPRLPIYEGDLRSELGSYARDLIRTTPDDVGGEPDLTIVLGDSPGPEGDRVLRVSGGAWQARVGPNAPGRWVADWPMGAFAAAAAGAAEGFRVALQKISISTRLPLPPRPGLVFTAGRTVILDLRVPGLRARPIDVGDIDFISGGAITSAALFCLSRLPGLAGRARVIEPDRLDISNLNRYAAMRRSDFGRYKANVLEGLSTDRFTISAVIEHFDEESRRRIGALSARVLVGVDDIPSRWTVQRSSKGWVCVAGTSHFYALVTSHRPGIPCAGCAHPRDETIPGPIPTISFVSFWAGLMQARALLADAVGAEGIEAALHIWPTGLYANHGLHSAIVAPRADCPVGCAAAKAVA